jgi:hypothetical protein
MLCAARRASGQLTYISTTDPVYHEIEELQARGYLSQLSQTEKPWLTSDVARAINADRLAFDAREKEIAEQILDCLKPPQVKEAELISAGFDGGFSARGLGREHRGGYYYWRDQLINRNFRGELGSTYNAGFWISRESRWGIDTELLFDSDGTGFPWYYGTAHNARIVGQFDHAYLTVQAGRFDFLAGRERLIWGPSPRGSLLLDDNSPPLDLLDLAFTLKPFKLSAFAARLDDYYDPSANTINRRFLSGHRLRFMPGKGWEFGFSEIYLYGGPDRLPELFYNIPIVLYYWEQQNRRLDDNAFWGLDVSWVKKGLGRFYTQMVADDIQRQHRGPQKLAYQFGGHLAPAKLSGWSALVELNLVDTYVYGQRRRLNAYLNWGHPISRLDSDQREIFIGIYKRLSVATELGARFESRDKGEYDAADYQPNMVPFGVPFPSGLVERTRNYELIWRWHDTSRINGQLSVGYETVRNFGHQRDHSIDQYFVTAQISYGIRTGLPFWKSYR